LAVSPGGDEVIASSEYTVKVQWGIGGLNATNTTFRLDDWTLAVQEAD
jgi:hypothetical protein